MKNDIKSTYGSWVLVAGAAEGLGRAFSQSLARRGINVILVDQKTDLLNSLAGQLENTFGILVKKLPLDLAEGDAVNLMMETIR